MCKMASGSGSGVETRMRRPLRRRPPAHPALPRPPSRRSPHPTCAATCSAAPPRGQRMIGTTPSVASTQNRRSTTSDTAASIWVSWAAGSFSCEAGGRSWSEVERSRGSGLVCRPSVLCDGWVEGSQVRPPNTGPPPAPACCGTPAAAPSCRFASDRQQHPPAGTCLAGPG